MLSHLSKGSVDPPLKDGKVRLYSMLFCPYAQRVHLVLLAKDIAHDPVFINLSEKPEWYIQTVPTGKVPALKAEGTTLYESLIIADYLDEQYGGRKLNSDKPLQRALDRIFIDSYKIPGTFYNIFVNGGTNKTIFAEILASIEPIEKELEIRETKFLGGNDHPGLVDYMIWPWLERFPAIALMSGPEYSLPSAKFPKLEKYIADLKTDNVVQKFYISPEKHFEYFKKKFAGDLSAYDVKP